ncbi:hypothetical protein TNCV_255911 [Trichonephila clavipes]|nr:hypothetical protein TNCV_255911 [Trichonephila clavipes]
MISSSRGSVESASHPIISFHISGSQVPRFPGIGFLYCDVMPCDASGLSSNEANFWLNGYVNKQNCRIWSEANPQVYVETPLHPEKLTVWYALWAGGILLQKR